MNNFAITRLGPGLFTCVLLLSPICVEAALLTEVQVGNEYLVVEYSAGLGPYSSYVVIDFANAGGGTHAFGYQFSDANATGHDALVALAGAGALEYLYTEYNFGGGLVPYVDNFSYLGESGNVSAFWSFSVGSYDSATSSLAWSTAATGAGEQILQDGDFQGWYNGFGPPPNFDAIFPSVPTAAAAGVPEPDTLCMGLTSLLIWIGFRFCGRFTRTH